MAIIYTKHAVEMISFRSIKKDLVEECIEYPDDILSAREGKTIYLKGFRKKFLKVIGFQVEADIVVVTLYWLAKKRVKR